MGRHGSFVSNKGKLLGVIVKVDDKYLADRVCCRSMLETTWLRMAALHILKTLECADCAQRRIHAELARWS